MEKINSILENIKERLSNPLIFSFLISWILINWDVTVALLWYDPPQVDKGHYSLIKYIADNTSWWNSIWKPLLFAIGYTALIPIIKQFVSTFYIIIENAGDRYKIRYSKEGYVSAKYHLEVQAAYEEQMKITSQIINASEDTKKELQDFRRKSEELQSMYNNVQKNFELSEMEGATAKKLAELRTMELMSIKDIAPFIGEYKLTIDTLFQGRVEQFAKRLYITESNEFRIRHSDVSVDVYKIESFFYDDVNKTAIFSLNREGGPAVVKWNVNKNGPSQILEFEPDFSKVGDVIKVN